MRQILLLCAALTFLSAPPAVAQSPDTIGLWFDAAYTVSVGPIQVGVPFEAFLVLHEPTTTVTGLEIQYEVSDPNIIVLQGSWHHDAIVDIVDDCIVVGFATPLPVQPAILLATFSYVVITSPAQIMFSVTACSGEVCPLYRGLDGEPVCLETTLGGGIVACLGDCGVGAEQESWSAVKSLYR